MVQHHTNDDKHEWFCDYVHVKSPIIIEEELCWKMIKNCGIRWMI